MCDVPKHAYWNTELQYRINFEKCRIDTRKTVLFEKFSNFTAFFLLTVQSIFKIFESESEFSTKKCRTLMYIYIKILFGTLSVITLCLPAQPHPPPFSPYYFSCPFYHQFDFLVIKNSVYLVFFLT